jgi:hypothetical protein
METNEEGNIERSQESPHPFTRAIENNKNDDNSNIFERAEDMFGNSSSGNEDETKPIRISGNGESLLKVMTHGNIRQEILQEARKGVI